MAISNAGVGSWFGESTANTPKDLAVTPRSSFDMCSEGKSFNESFADLFEQYKTTGGIDIKRDMGAMIADRAFMEQYKEDLLSPIKDGFMAASENDPHMATHAANVDMLWDSNLRSYNESASVTGFLPISTLEFPVLAKQYYASITKDIIEVEAVKSPNIVKHIKTTYLVDNNTGDMYEYPKCIFEGTWEKIWDAAKGVAFPSDVSISIADGEGFNLNVVNFANVAAATDLSDPTATDYATNLAKVQAAVHPTATTGPSADADGFINFADGKLSYNIRITKIDYAVTSGSGDTATTKTYTVVLPGQGITVDLATNGNLVNGNLNFTTTVNGTQVIVEDVISGRVDFQKGTMSVSSASGKTTGIYIEGYLSNEDNERSVSVREVRSLEKFMIEDGPRWNMPFTIEEIEDAGAMLDMNYYNRMVDEIVRTQEMIESQSVLKFFETEYQKFKGVNFNRYNLESIVSEGYVDLKAPAGFAGDPFKYMANAVQFAVKGMIHKLTDAAKLDNLSFVIVGNPMATQLLSEWTTWKMQQGTTVGGITVNNSYGFMTDMGAPVRIVASNQINAYTQMPATLSDAIKAAANDATYAAGKKELYIRILAYPTDPEHISFRHLKYTSHLLATPSQSAYMANGTAPNGAYNIITATSRYKDIVIQGLQCKLMFLNSSKVYGA